MEAITRFLLQIAVKWIRRIDFASWQDMNTYSVSQSNHHCSMTWRLYKSMQNFYWLLQSLRTTTDHARRLFRTWQRVSFQKDLPSRKVLSIVSNLVDRYGEQNLIIRFTNKAASTRRHRLTYAEPDYNLLKKSIHFKYQMWLILNTV